MDQKSNVEIAQAKPPTEDTLAEFFKAGLSFGLALADDGTILVPADHMMRHVILQYLVEFWVTVRGVSVICTRNSTQRIEATVVRQSKIQGVPPRALCRFVASSEGEAAYKAILLFEDMLAKGEFSHLLHQPPASLLGTDTNKAMTATEVAKATSNDNNSNGKSNGKGEQI